MAESVPEYNIITGRRNNSFPKRSDTMYLGKISNMPKRSVATRQTNRLDDIAKAQPKRFSEMYTHNMPDLHNVDDIPGAKPGVLHASLNKQNRTRLEHHGASTQTIRRTTSHRWR